MFNHFDLYDFQRCFNNKHIIYKYFQDIVASIINYFFRN